MTSLSVRFRRGIRTGSWASAGLVALLGSGLSPAASAQQSGAAAPPAAAAPAAAQESVTEELIRLLQQHNALSKEDAESLIRKLQAQQTQPAQPPAGSSAPAAASAAPAQPEAKKGDVRVIYIPESEKQKIREQVKQEVLATAKAENWAQPNALPDWLNRISFYGDFRYRQEFDLYDRSNYNLFTNFQAINSGSPFDISAVSNGIFTGPPIFNTTENRELPRFRARLGVDGKVNDDLTASFRFSTGNTTNPVSTNQTLGSDFNKYTFVIDRAYLDYHPNEDFTAWLGRMPRPWVSTQLVWWEDLSFDGAAFKAQRRFGSFKPFFTAGAFSVENTALDFPSNSASKVASRDKWLFAGQLGTVWQASRDLEATAAAAYYYYHHIDGLRSSPCSTQTAADTCDTDNTRPAFMQKGNTLFQLRDTSLTPLGSGTVPPSFQYFGLASRFHELDLLASLDWQVQGPVHAVFTGDYVRNLAYEKQRVLDRLNQTGGFINNFGPCQKKDANGNCIEQFYEGGNQGFQLQALVGYPQIHERWQWSGLIGYRREETDAVLDAFNDPDFGAVNGVGGTNLKGYFINGSLGLAHNTWAQLRYFSANQVTGEPFSADIIQLDLNAGF